jgi:hypothetical protein
MATSVNNAAWLQWMASLMAESRQSYTATLPQDRYHCVLDELPLHLIPSHSRSLLEDVPDRVLVLNPACELRMAGDLPAELSKTSLASDFALQGTIAWVRPAGGGTLPFWLSNALAVKVGDLRENEPVPESFPAGTRALLAAAGILVPAESNGKPSSARPDSRWRLSLQNRDECVRRAASRFQSRGYAPLGGLIHPFHVAALRRYYRRQIRAGKIELGDHQSSRRYIAHNEPVARFFHHQLTSVLSQVAGTALRPSYVYFASYLGGADLKKHTDREQCDYSITFCLDFSPEPELPTPWPISLQTSVGTVRVFQALGDGLAYRGTQLPHFRGALREGQTSTSIFFHYVGEDFAGSLD